MGTRFFFFSLFIFSFSGSAQSAIIPLNPFFYQDDFVISEDKISGDWKGQETWAGTVCDGGYTYTVAGRGDVEKMDMVMADEGHLDVQGEIRNISAAISGSYRSGLTLCKRLSSVLDADADKLVVNARVWLEDSNGELYVKLRVLDSHIGRVYFSRYFPNWFEEFLTDILNRSMNYIWTTSLGDWIGDKVGESLAASFPDGARVSVQQ